MGDFFNAMEKWTKLMNELDRAKSTHNPFDEKEVNESLKKVLDELISTNIEDREDRLVFELVKRLDRAELKVRELTDAIN